jgi:hypothetical protein
MTPQTMSCLIAKFCSSHILHSIYKGIVCMDCNRISIFIYFFSREDLQFLELE